jgi:hypothetical protein
MNQDSYLKALAYHFFDRYKIIVTADEIADVLNELGLTLIPAEEAKLEQQRDLP